MEIVSVVDPSMEKGGCIFDPNLPKRLRRHSCHSSQPRGEKWRYRRNSPSRTPIHLWVLRRYSCHFSQLLGHIYIFFYCGSGGTLRRVFAHLNLGVHRPLLNGVSGIIHQGHNTSFGCLYTRLQHT